MRPTILLLTLIALLITLSSFSQPGTLDSTFNKDGKVFTSIGSYKDGANAVAIQKNGKIVTAGYSEDSTGKSAFALVRYLTRGKVDSSFGNNGIVTTYFRDKSSIANAIAVQSDGKIIVAGYSGYSKKTKYNSVFSIARYMPDGSLDVSFGLKGKVITDIDSLDDQANSIAIQPDGKIVVCGYTTNFNYGGGYPNDIAVLRYNPNGTPDSSFGVNGKVITDFIGFGDPGHPHDNDYGNAVAVLPNGKIIVGGHSDVFDGNNAFVLFRYKSNGIIDSSFGFNGMALTFIDFYSYGTSMAILPDEQILLAGYSLGLWASIAVVKYKKNGLMDGRFGQNGRLLVSTYPYLRNNFGKSMAVQQNGKIIVAGFASNGIDITQLEIMRCTPRGRLDSSFGRNGIVFTDLQSKYDYYKGDPAPAIALDPDGKIIVAGNGQNKFAVVRYNGDPVTENNIANLASKQNFTSNAFEYLSPNPVKDILHLQHLSSSTKTISIVDLKGKVLQQAVTADNNFSFNVSQLSAGMYFIKIIDDRKTTTLKFLKE
jgi:uncharacterized delta-60 repeat protein